MPQELSGVVRSFNFDVNSTMFNVIIVWETPCGSLPPRREIQIANTAPLEWKRACVWVRSVLEGIGRKWVAGSKYQDIYIEPAWCPRPWTPELYAMFQREMREEMKVPTVKRLLWEIDQILALPPCLDRARVLHAKQQAVNSFMGA